MIKIEYQCNQENFAQLYSYQAMHDRKIQKRMLSIMIPLIVVIVVLVFLALKLTLTATAVSIVLALLVFKLFPKFFWKTEFKRIDKILADTPLKFKKTKICFDHNIEIWEETKHFQIEYYQLEKLDFTKDTCILFYREGKQINTLLIPIQAFNEQDLKNFCSLMERKINHE